MRASCSALKRNFITSGRELVEGGQEATSLTHMLWYSVPMALRRQSLLLLASLLMGVTAGAVTAQRLPLFLQAASSSSLHMNERFIETVGTVELDLKNPDVVFAYVFAQLPQLVRVYPTENYYYFTFHANSQQISGNIRLDVEDRQVEVVDFAYFGVVNNPTKREDLDYTRGFKQFTGADGVRLVQQSPLAYVISYRGKDVTFLLNDLLQTLPEGVVLPAGEQFMARTFDESGFQFVLVYDTVHPQFRFVLDETASLPDVLQELEPGLLVGRLSGFAFFDDIVNHRKVLVGVDGNDIRRNNYYDGPFDQLADNFVHGDTLKGAMETTYPYVRGHIDYRGVFIDSNGKPQHTRLALTPYSTYDSLVELHHFVADCRHHRTHHEVLTCLTHDFKQDVPPATHTATPSRLLR